MKVKLVAYMQLNPELFDEYYGFLDDTEAIAAACMRTTQTDESFIDILNEQDNEKVKKRVQSAAKYKPCGHWTVYGMMDFMFVIEGVSRVLTHQLVRHRTAWFLQQSSRAVDPTGMEHIIPETMKKVGWDESYVDHIERSAELYHMMREDGVPLEDCRFVLHQSTPQRIIMKIDGSNLIHFLKLRTDKHAQWEIRELANKIWDEVKKVAPNAYADELQEYWW